MNKFKLFGVLVILGIEAINCAVPRKGPLVDPSVVRFPLVEAGTFEIEGTVVGQPRARDGIVYFATREGFLTAIVVPARQVLWRFKADHAVSASPELGESHILLRDDGNTLYVLDRRGSVVLKKPLDEAATSAVREHNGRVFFGTASGKVVVLDIASGGSPFWEYRASATATTISAGPVITGDLVIVGAADGKLMALDQAGRPVWEFAAKGAITADPAADNGRLYFGTEGRSFYCLNTATGKKIWSRRLQGAPLHPALAFGGRLVFAASNSVVYFLSRRGGSILSWEAVPSRVVYKLVAAGRLLLISSASPNLVALDISTGKPVGQHLAAGPLAAGALWVSPFVVLVEEAADSGRQRLVFLRPEPAAASIAPGTRAPGF